MPDKDPRGDMSSYLQNLVKKVVKSGFNVDRRDSAAVYNNSDFVEKARNFLTWTYIGEPAFRRHLENLIDSDTKIFDGGSAGGRVSLLFTEMGADPHNIVGVEIAEAQVEKARIVLPGADFRVGSVADPLPEVDYFDIAVSNMVTEFLDKATFESALRSMYSAMKPGGTGVFITTHPDRFTKKHGVTEEGYFKSSGPWEGPSFDNYFRTTDTFIRSAKEAGFSISDVEELEMPQEMWDNEPEKRSSGFESFNTYARLVVVVRK